MKRVKSIVKFTLLVFSLDRFLQLLLAHKVLQNERWHSLPCSTLLDVALAQELIKAALLELIADEFLLSFKAISALALLFHFLATDVAERDVHLLLGTELLEFEVANSLALYLHLRCLELGEIFTCYSMK